MKELNKLFDDIEFKYQDESKKYRRLKICKYLFEISKVCILSLSVGLRFISIFSILSLILIPIIDSVKFNSNIDSRIYEGKFLKISS